MEADVMNVDEPLNDNYAAYLGAMQLVSDSIGYPFPVMTEVQFRQACEDDGYVHTSLIDMDAFEAAFQRS
jgi:hypothetical protein